MYLWNLKKDYEKDESMFAHPRTQLFQRLIPIFDNPDIVKLGVDLRNDLLDLEKAFRAREGHDLTWEPESIVNIDDVAAKKGIIQVC